MKKIIELGEWTPDDPDLGNSATVATNVTPWKKDYRSFPAFSVYSSAISSRAQGSYAATDSAGAVYNLVGNATKLLQLTAGTSYTDITKAASSYTTDPTEWWEFAQFGQNVIATNFADPIQSLTLGGANFADLAGSPPKARHLGVVNNFLVLGNVGSNPNRVQWSGINDTTSWSPSQATQSDYQDIQGDGGWVQQIVPGGPNYGLVFLERQVWRMSYVGVPLIFQFDIVERNRGLYAPQGSAAWSNIVFYLAADGFHMIVGGSQSIPIGDGRVDRYFLNDVDSTNFYRVQAAIDPVNKFVMWGYPGSGNVSGNINKIILYNWVIDRWSIVTGQALESLLKYFAIGYTLEGLDAISASLDALGPSLDSKVWMGGAPSLAGFNTSHQLGTFTGAALDATVDTGEVELFPGYRSEITQVRPLTDGNAASISIGTRNRIADSVTFGSAITQDSTGFCPALVSANLTRYRTNTTGAFNFIMGVEVDATKGGER